MESPLALISQAAGLISILTLFYASIGMPFDKISWEGQTPQEKRHRRKQNILKWIGIPCAFIAVGCQTLITLSQRS